MSVEIGLLVPVSAAARPTPSNTVDPLAAAERSLA